MGLGIFRDPVAFSQIPGGGLKPSVNKTWVLLIGILIVCIFASWVGWRIAYVRSAAISHHAEESLKREIEKELPVGSDQVRVVEFLRAHSIYTDGLKRVGNNERTLYAGASGVIFASTSKLKTPISVCQIVVTFRFDDKDRLLGYSDQIPCNGPF